jgi:hypothetical protein
MNTLDATISNQTRRSRWIGGGQSKLGKRPEQPISRILSPIQISLDLAAIIHLWMPVARHLLRPTRELGRAILKSSPIWSCTGWGLPSFSGHPENWCALTAPFHPYPTPNRTG